MESFVASLPCELGIEGRVGGGRETGEIFVWPDATVPIVLGSRLCECILPLWGGTLWAFPSAGQPIMTNTVCCLCLGVVCANTFHHFLEKISGRSLQQDSPQ